MLKCSALLFRDSGSNTSLPLISMLESLYLLGIIPLELYNSVIHHMLGLSSRLPFIPLLLTSVYCAVGVTYCWLTFYWQAFQDKPTPKYGKQN